MYINVDAVGVKTITAYLKCIFYGKYIYIYMINFWWRVMSKLLLSILNAYLIVNIHKVWCHRVSKTFTVSKMHILLLYLKCILR